MADKVFQFADFELDGSKRLLLRSGVAVALNSKTFDLLELLVERSGEILSKTELLDLIWDGQIVEENNLTVQISALRKLLGETRGENRFVVTVPGKGYKFVGDLVSDPIEKEIEVSPEPEIPAKREGLNVKATTKFAYVGIGAVCLAAMIVGGFFVFRSPAKKVRFGRNEVRQLTNNGKVETAAISPDGKLFAYVTSEFGQCALWTGQVDGGNSIQLRPPAEGAYLGLAFSPDNSSLYFSVRDAANPASALFRMPSFGGVESRVAEKASRFALSPDGKQIAYAMLDLSTRVETIWLRNAAGGEPPKAVTSAAVNDTILNSLSFSPDGQEIAYGVSSGAGQAGVNVVRLATGEVRRITPTIFGDIDKTAWLPDASGILMTAVESNSWSGVPQFHVWQINVADGVANKITTDLSSYGDGLGTSKDLLLTVETRQLNNVWIAPALELSSAKQITFGAFGKYDGLWGLDWTPDGRIVFDSSDTESQIISIMDADGTNRKQLTNGGNIDSDLSVSPDGRYIVFHSSRGGGFDIWRMDADGTNLKQLTTGKHNFQPSISADSRYVFYKSLDSDEGGLTRISIDGGEPVKMNNVDTSWTATAPDGQYIAAQYRNGVSRLAIFSSDGGQPVKQFDVPKSATFFVGIRWDPDSRSVVYRDNGFGYWRQSLDGGPPTRVENLPKELLYNFAWSKDGKQFAFVRGQKISDVVLFKDVE